MTARKRGRSADDDDADQCLPISKRINRLHIRYSTDDNSHLPTDVGLQYNNNLPIGDPNCCPPSTSTNNHPAGAGHVSPLHMPDVNHMNSSHIHSPNTAHQHNGHGQFAHSTSPDPQGGISPPCSTNQLSPHQAGEGGVHQGFPSPPPPTPYSPHPQADPYHPELKAEENPHYYHINEVLYKANWERMHRHKPEFPPS